ncbi:uncharacterized protein LOC133517586 [Cydia pomonella]|uniref:uncharacterized protein LOC133517586 n=1 Tax=Cydia pomonella TaxID=82600 RepID=UPI002ADE0FAF|nr:uncharacterized protein LOC133517586 [Cydia pomonella]XP_061706897.1 uncharacterized protein LOC133517586 [Cydia pomonella]
MGKRKHKHNDKDIRRKIQRLEEKLRYNRRKDLDRRSDCSTSGSSQNSYYDRQSPDVEDVESRNSEYGEDWMLREEAFMDDEIHDSTRSLASQVQPVVNSPIASPLPRIAAAPAPAPSLPLIPTVPAPDHAASVQTNPAQSVLPTEVDKSTTILPEEILCLLGEAKKLDEPLGECIPDELSERWGKILTDGLAKDVKQSLVDKILMPSNFLLARAPKLNPEVAAVINESAKNRDIRLEKAQNQLGRGIAGLANLANDLIKSELDKLDIIKKISEVTQVLLDLHYEESINRNKLLVPLLDKKFWSTIKGVKRDEYLFGEKLGDKIKNSKDIEKSGQQIKKSFTFNPAFQHRKQTAQPGNARAPPRQYKPKATPAPTTGRYYEPQSSTSARRTTSSQRRGRHYSSSKANDRSRR